MSECGGDFKSFNLITLSLSSSVHTHSFPYSSSVLPITGQYYSKYYSKFYSTTATEEAVRNYDHRRGD